MTLVNDSASRATVVRRIFWASGALAVLAIALDAFSAQLLLGAEQYLGANGRPGFYLISFLITVLTQFCAPLAVGLFCVGLAVRLLSPGNGSLPRP